MSADWKVIETIDVQARLSISDTSYFFDEPVIVEVPAGRYQVSVCIMSTGGEARVVAARAVLATDVSRGKKLGVVVVDFAQLGICDRDAVEQVFDSFTNDEMPLYFDQLQTPHQTGIATLPGAKVVFTTTGYGDGEYPIYEVCGPDGERAGVQVDFIMNDHACVDLGTVR